MDDDETPETLKQRRQRERLSRVATFHLTRDGYDEFKWHVTTIFGPPDPVDFLPPSPDYIKYAPFTS